MCKHYVPDTGFSTTALVSILSADNKMMTTCPTNQIDVHSRYVSTYVVKTKIHVPTEGLLEPIIPLEAITARTLSSSPEMKFSTKHKRIYKCQRHTASV